MSNLPNTPGHRPSRRRFVTILGATALMPAAWTPAATAKPDLPPLTSWPPLTGWQGTALGADASIKLAGLDPAAATPLLARCTAEIRRLEALFSLYDPDSALSRLNRSGALDPIPPDFAHLMDLCAQYHHDTAGAFDPTVQPLWQLYAAHFATAPDNTPDATGPSEQALAHARARIGFHRLTRDGGSLRLGSGQALTLNGIAQGFITDRIASLLKQNGVRHVLVDLGEISALGHRAPGHPWRVGVRDPNAPWSLADTLDLTDGAMATSGGYGTPFERTGRFHHLLDPRTARPANLYRSVTVIAPTATEADALSTGFSMLPPDDIERALRRRPGRRVILFMNQGEKGEIGARRTLQG